MTSQTDIDNLKFYEELMKKTNNKNQENQKNQENKQQKMENVISKINEKIKTDENTDTSENTSEKEYENKTNKNKKNIFSKIYGILKEPVLFILLYIILSLDITKQLIGTYFTQILPDHDGNVIFTGILLYGFIFMILFMILRKIV